MSTGSNQATLSDANILAIVNRGKSRDKKFILSTPDCAKYRQDFKKNLPLISICGHNGCTAQIWCHPYSTFFIEKSIGKPQYPLCTLSRQDILSDEARWMTTTGLCVPCLQKKVCCLAADHPKDSNHQSEKPTTEINLDPFKIESFDVALKSDFQPGFRIPVSTSNIKKIILKALSNNEEEYHKYFVDGNPWEYEYEFISWIRGSKVYKGEVDVSHKNSLWQIALQDFLPYLQFSYNSRDPSCAYSSKRPDVVFLHNSVPFLKMEEKDSDTDYNKALSQLMRYFFPGCYDSFPQGSNTILGIVSTHTRIGLYKIESSSFSFDKHNPTIQTAEQYEKTLIKDYLIDRPTGRMQFFLQMIKISRWVCTITKTNGHFNLIAGEKTETPNGHTVLWDNDVIIKKFNPEVFFQPGKHQLEYIEQVYKKKFLNIEWGEIISKDPPRIKITRIGTPLRILLYTNQITKDEAITQISKGISQLQTLDFAHCDLKLDNIYGRYEVKEGTDAKELVIFLDDLEYLTKLDDPAPLVKHCYPKEVPENFTAWDLHLIQFQQLYNEITDMILEPEKKKKKLT